MGTPRFREVAAVLSAALGLAGCEGAVEPRGGAATTDADGSSAADVATSTQTPSGSGSGSRGESAPADMEPETSGPSPADAGAPDDAAEQAIESPAVPLPPSCQAGLAGLTDCSATPESCCTSLEVEGGTYFRTYSNSGSGPTGEADPATVSSFRLDKYLVTVGRFRQFVAAWNAGYLPPDGSGKHVHLNDGRGLSDVAAPNTFETGWDATDWNSQVAPTDANLSSGDYVTWTTAAGANENLPINCENWYEAYAFCIWDGGFLPSEAELEYAAAGGSQQREYPWGSADPGTANQYAIYDCNYPGSLIPFLKNCEVAPVGSAASGAGLWGQLDLAGELWEWNVDVWNGTYVDPCVDGAYLTGSCSCRTLRGGTYASDSTEYLAPYRTTAASNPSAEFDTPDTHGDGLGFRCARTP